MMISRPVLRWMASTDARLVHAAGWMYIRQGVLLCCVVCMARTLGERFTSQHYLKVKYVFNTFG